MDSETGLVLFFLIAVPVLPILYAFGLAATEAQKKKLIEEARKWDKPKVSGDAGFSTDRDCRRGRLLTGKGIWLAFSQASGRVLRYFGDIHLITIGPTGCGKARDSLVAAILDLGRKVLLAYDPKGQLLAICYRARLRVGPVYALSPFRYNRKPLKGVTYVRYNPMATLTPDSPALGIQCDKIADGLVMDDGDPRSRFWNDGAKELLSGLMMALVCHGAPEDKNLVALCRVLCGDVYGYCREVVAKTTNSYIRDRLGPYAEVDPKEGPGRAMQDIVQTARVNTKFIRNELIGPSLCGCDITFKELREKPGSYFIEIPVDAPPDIADRYYRLIIAGALAEILSDDCLGKTPVLFVLDEAAGLGRLAALEQAITMARGFGIQIWSVFTDIPTMQRLYREGFRSFLANCGCAMFFPPNDMTTCEEISRLSGTTEIVSQSRSYIVDPETGEPRVTEGMGQHGSRPLLLPHEVRELGSSGKSELLIIAQGVKGIIRAKRRPYWKTHPGKYCPDPYEKGKRH